MTETLQLSWKQKAIVQLPAIVGAAAAINLFIAGAVIAHSMEIGWRPLLVMAAAGYAGLLFATLGHETSDDWRENLEADERVKW